MLSHGSHVEFTQGQSTKVMKTSTWQVNKLDQTNSKQGQTITWTAINNKHKYCAVKKIRDHCVHCEKWKREVTLKT